MIARIHRVATSLVFAIGVIHTVGTFVYFDALAEPAIWFAGAGLGGIFVSLLNATLWPANVPAVSLKLASVANCLFVVWLLAGVVAMPGMPPKIIAIIGITMAALGLIIASNTGATSKR